MGTIYNFSWFPSLRIPCQQQIIRDEWRPRDAAYEDIKLTVVEQKPQRIRFPSSGTIVRERLELGHRRGEETSALVGFLSQEGCLLHSIEPPQRERIGMQ